MKKIILSPFLVVLFVILLLLALKLLGYNFNKSFLSFNRSECIEKEFPTYYHHPGIEGCIFWSRNDDLETRENWLGLYKHDDEYCEGKYKNKNTSWDLLNGEAADPKCNYEAFRNQKRQENWNYLTSKEKDIFYDKCAQEICKRPPMFK